MTDGGGGRTLLTEGCQGGNAPSVPLLGIKGHEVCALLIGLPPALYTYIGSHIPLTLSHLIMRVYLMSIKDLVF